MSVLRSKLDTSGDDYQQNLAEMEALWAEVDTLMASVPSIGGQRYVDRHRKRGKMLPRERIEIRSAEPLRSSIMFMTRALLSPTTILPKNESW